MGTWVPQSRGISALANSFQGGDFYGELHRDGDGVEKCLLSDA